MQMLIRMLSRNKRSVLVARDLLSYILTTKDVEALREDRAAVLECITSKFKLLHDLSVTLKVPLNDLLRYSSDSTCGKITYYLILSPDTLAVLEHYITMDFFLSQILHRSWFYLLNTQKITH